MVATGTVFGIAFLLGFLAGLYITAMIYEKAPEKLDAIAELVGLR